MTITADETIAPMLDLFAGLTDRLVPASEPALAFGALAQACVPALGERCTVELIEDGTAPHRLSHPQPEPDAEVDSPTEAEPASDRSFSGSITRRLLQIGQAVVTTEDEMTVAVVGVGSDGPDYVGAVTCSRSGRGEPTAVDVRLLQLLIGRTVAQVAHERAQRAALVAANARLANLELALDSNRTIGMAMGILMASTRCTPEDAFGVLRRASQESNRKLRDVADDVVMTGAVPQTSARRNVAGSR